MAFPTTISGVILLTDANNDSSDIRPYISSGGNVYIVLIDSTDRKIIECHKATDPTSSFTEQDSTNRPVHASNNYDALATFQVADVIHIASQDSAGDIEYHTFNMATDSWGTTEESVTTTPDGTAGVSIAVRDDGDVIILHQGEKDNDMGQKERIDYSRKEASWTTDVQVHNAGATSYKMGCVVKGGSDRMHFFFLDAAAQDAYQRTLNSANSLETYPSAFDTTTGSGDHRPTQGVSYDDDGTIRVRVPYRDSSDDISIAKLDSNADAPTVSVDVDASDNTVLLNFEPVCSLSVKLKELQLLYANSADSDLYRDTNDDDAGWGSDTEVLDAVTINRVYSNVFIRSGNYRLAYVYDDGGTVKYNEVDLGAATVDFPEELFKKNITRRRFI